MLAKLLLNNYSYVGADLRCMQWNIHDPAALCDTCKCVRSKCQFAESSWVLQRKPSCLTGGNVIKLHLFMWTFQTHSFPPALETKDVELPRGEWPGGHTHAYQLDLTPIVPHTHAHTLCLDWPPFCHRVGVLWHFIFDIMWHEWTKCYFIHQVIQYTSF